MAKETDPLAVLRAHLARHGTQVKTARALGISQVYLSDILNGRAPFSESVLRKIGLRWAVVVDSSISHGKELA